MVTFSMPYFEGLVYFRAVMKTGFISISQQVLVFMEGSTGILSTSMILFTHSVSFDPRLIKYQACMVLGMKDANDKEAGCRPCSGAYNLLIFVKK